MKKLSLKNLKLEANEMLQRSQLKTILGGGYGACNAHSGCSTGCAYIYENRVKCNSCCIA